MATATPRKKKILSWLLGLGDFWSFVECCGQVRRDVRVAKLHICDACKHPSVKVVYKLFHPDLPFDPKNLYVGLDCAAYLCGYGEDKKRFKHDLRLGLKRILAEIVYSEGLLQTLEREAATLPDRIKRARSEDQGILDHISIYTGRSRRLAETVRRYEASVRGLRDKVRDLEKDANGTCGPIEVEHRLLEEAVRVASHKHDEVRERHANRRSAVRTAEEEANSLAASYRAIEHKIQNQQIYQRQLASLAGPIKLTQTSSGTRCRIAHRTCYIQRQPRTSILHYWIEKKPPKPGGTYYNADLAASQPDGQCETNEQAILAMKKIILAQLDARYPYV